MDLQRTAFPGWNGKHTEEMCEEQAEEYSFLRNFWVSWPNRRKADFNAWALD